ncbi:MAG: beta-lactamase family protein [Fimbriimonadaceae bacterium]|nr:beta-lactamase family protein [Fimbriimonadaceae bacterium]
MREAGIVGCSVGIVDTDTGRLVFQGAFGFQDLASRKRMTVNTTIRSGSISKSFTGCVILELSERGILRLDEPSLPSLKAGGIEPRTRHGSSADDRLSQITVRHLLDHTAGFRRASVYLANWFVSDWVGKVEHPTSADVIRCALGREKLVFDPGEQHEYANLNFLVLGEIIKIKTGKPYGSVLQELVLSPMGITPAEVHISLVQRDHNSPGRGANEAAHYQQNNVKHDSIFERGKRVSESFGGFDTEIAAPYGAISCSLVGLTKFVSNLYSSRTILSRQSMSEILTPPPYAAHQSNTFPNNLHFYSKGFGVELFRGVPQIAHGGMLQHAGAYFGPANLGDSHQRKYCLVILSNCNLRGSPWVDERLKETVVQWFKNRFSQKS